MPTSATRCWNPSRSVSAPERPRSLSITTMLSVGQPSATARSPQRVLAPRALAMVEHLALSRLTHVQVGIAAQVARGHLLVSGVHAASLPI